MAGLGAERARSQEQVYVQSIDELVDFAGADGRRPERRAADQAE